MSADRSVHVHLSPLLVPPARLHGCVAVVIDVLRATTTIVHALAAGCGSVVPVAEVEEARRLAAGASGEYLLAGERDGLPLPGFDCGNSPGEFTPARCGNKVLVLTTTNGTRALLHAALAERVLVGAFVNFSAVCEQLINEPRPIHIVCAGESGSVALEDTLLAGAFAGSLGDKGLSPGNDGARLALDCFAQHGRNLEQALISGSGGSRLRALGYDEDIRAAARVDTFALVPELRRDPLRIVVGADRAVPAHWHA
jgi:2-phosphosulfolactate phosphatase